MVSVATKPREHFFGTSLRRCAFLLDTWPDVGFGSLSVTLEKGFDTSTTVFVVENKGRYKSNQAKRQIICKVKLVKKLAQGREDQKVKA